MGRWMEVLTYPPADVDLDPSRRKEFVVGEVAPNPLMNAANCLPRSGRRHFPMLDHVALHSSAYLDEHLWLSAKESEKLLDEVRRLRRICRREEFVHGLRGDDIWSFWRGADNAGEFDQWLDSIEHLLAIAVSRGYWVHLMQ